MANRVYAALDRAYQPGTRVWRVVPWLVVLGVVLLVLGGRSE